MKIKVNQEMLAKTLGIVGKAISSRTTIPILTGFKLIAVEEGLKIIGSDSDLTIEAFIPLQTEDKINAEIIEQGSTVVTANIFENIVKKLPQAEVEITVENLNMKLTSGSASCNLNTLDAEEYPKLPQAGSTNTLKLEQSVLASVIGDTSFAVATTETRPVLTGVCFSINNKVLTAIATDSHRLAMKKVPIADDVQLESTVIPAKSLNVIAGMFSEGEVVLSFSNTQVCFEFGYFKVFSRLLDGKYPVTQNMIPTSFKTRLIGETKMVHGGLDRCLILSKDNKNYVVTLSNTNSGAELTSVTPEIGKVIENIQCSIEGEDLKVAFNGKNIVDAMKRIKAEECELGFTGSMSPFVIKAIGDESSLHLFSPVRTY